MERKKGKGSAQPKRKLSAKPKAKKPRTTPPPPLELTDRYNFATPRTSCPLQRASRTNYLGVCVALRSHACLSVPPPSVCAHAAFAPPQEYTHEAHRRTHARAHAHTHAGMPCHACAARAHAWE